MLPIRDLDGLADSADVLAGRTLQIMRDPAWASTRLPRERWTFWSRSWPSDRCSAPMWCLY
jgi:hypothetical protein